MNKHNVEHIDLLFTSVERFNLAATEGNDDDVQGIEDCARMTFNH